MESWGLSTHLAQTCVRTLALTPCIVPKISSSTREAFMRPDVMVLALAAAVGACDIRYYQAATYDTTNYRMLYTHTLSEIYTYAK
jgi:hypothetical protein